MIENRTFGLTEVRFAKGEAQAAETQADAKPGDESRMTGYAIVFESDSVDLGGFVERVAPAALTRSLTEIAEGKRNLQCLWSHDTSQPLGSTRSGKLVLTQDERGLAFDLSTARFTPQQLDAARDGDLQMSFGFRVRQDAWEERKGGLVIRTLLDVDLTEISAVAFPAYPDTSAALRSLEGWRSVTTEEDVGLRARVLRKLIDLRLRK
jgi:uncharacterized protein